MTKYVEIISAVNGFRRGGIAHPNVKTVHRVDAFNKEQLEQIKNEPRLSVRFFEIEDKKPETAPTEKNRTKTEKTLRKPIKPTPKRANK